jgi:hypothetical protein
MLDGFFTFIPRSIGHTRYGEARIGLGSVSNVCSFEIEVDPGVPTLPRLISLSQAKLAERAADLH